MGYFFGKCDEDVREIFFRINNKKFIYFLFSWVKIYEINIEI